MGCGQSTAAAGAVAAHGKQSPGTASTSDPKDQHSSSVGSGTSAAVGQTRNAPADPHSKRPEWAVRPGYSSGASSLGSDDDEDDVDGTVTPKHRRNASALSSLRQEMMDEGDLTKTVVRIETPYGKPIAEIYDGVQDGPVLGSGVSGVVRLVTHKATGVKYAVKCLDLGLIDSTEGLKQLRDEVLIMCQVDHPSIVRIEEVYESTNEIYIVQELCKGGDLFDRLDEQTDYHYTEAQCARLVKQMLSAVRYLHSKGIIHRDLKLENFLFSTLDPESELKMIDFGLSKHFEIGQHHCEKVGTPYSVAPEIIRGQYNEKSDIWSLGVIAYLLLSGETPFGGLDGENLLLVKENIMRAQVKFVPKDVWDHVSDAGKAFVKRILIPDPVKRPTARDAQRDEWIQIWAKKDAKSDGKLAKRTITALMNFKEQSDMQKLLSEVLSFTLLPEQIVELRAEFEKIDSDGDGEISLMALKRILKENAEAGALGALTEQEIEQLFDSIRVRKSEPTIRWHEFVAAGLSSAKVDDRNLRLAFDRLDSDHKGFISFGNLRDLLGSSAESGALEKIWTESLEACQAKQEQIDFDDFKRIMKGQPKGPQALHNKLPNVAAMMHGHMFNGSDSKLSTVTEGEPKEPSTGVAEMGADASVDDIPEEMPKPCYKKKRSRSHETAGTMWSLEGERSGSFPYLDARRAVMLSSDDADELLADDTISPLLVNRALYRRHREMRHAVLEASKQFDMKRTSKWAEGESIAGLIMRRGGNKPPVDVEDAHNRKMFEAAASRCGRAQRSRNKTVSDVSGMILRPAGVERN